MRSVTTYSAPDSPAAGSPSGLSVARVPVPAELADPFAFLRRFQGRPRGFWARRGRWIAHGGVASEIFLPTIGSASFREVAELGLGNLDVAVRWFGGFSYGGSGGDGAWRAFGGARFQAPRVILEWDEDGSYLTVADEGGDPAASARRWLEDLERPSPDTAGHRNGSAPSRPLAVSPDRETERRLWMRMVERALAAMSAGELHKVVLARSLVCRSSVDSLQALGRLHRVNPAAWTYYFEPESGAVLLGASPESLAVLEHGRLTATAVAGSRPRGANGPDDARMGNALMESAKDRHEHALVVEGMVERLKPLTPDVTPDPEPRLLSLSGIHHLETLIQAQVPDSVNVLDVLEAVHPTAAVCGSPRDRAHAFLTREEGMDRGWYGGPVGWFDQSGNGVFVPALRCAVSSGADWKLFAGAGIVVGSEPAREWDETLLKFKTALAALDCSLDG